MGDAFGGFPGGTDGCGGTVYPDGCGGYVRTPNQCSGAASPPDVHMNGANGSGAAASGPNTAGAGAWRLGALRAFLMRIYVTCVTKTASIYLHSTA